MDHSAYRSSTREKKPGRYLGFGFIMAGACFLFDPFVSVLDLLPDCIGYLFILLGLYRLSDLDDRIADAAKGVRYLLLIGLARILAFFLAFGLVSPTEQPVFILLVLFTLGVLDCIVLIPMWKNFCGGLLYLGTRLDATVMFDRRRRGGREHARNVLERYTTFTIAFFILREVLTVLPELSVLSSRQGGVELNEAVGYYDFVGLFRTVGEFISLVLGLVWLVMTAILIHRLKSDTPFFDRLHEKYSTEVLPRHDLFARRAVKASMVCLIAAAVLSLDFPVSGVSILPDFLAGGFLCLTVLLLRRYTGKNFPVLVTTVVYTLSAAFTWILELRYFNRNDIAEIHKQEELYTRWQHMVLLQALTTLLFLASVLLILKSIYGMVKRYTGIQAFSDYPDYAAQRTDSIHSLIRKKLILTAVFAGLITLSTLFLWGVVPTLPEWKLQLSGSDAHSDHVMEAVVNAAYQFFIQGYWFIDLCLGGAWIATLGSATGEITDQMEYSSMMKG